MKRMENKRGRVLQLESLSGSVFSVWFIHKEYCIVIIAARNPEPAELYPSIKKFFTVDMLSFIESDKNFNIILKDNFL